MAFCSNCGTKLEEGAKFCLNCGTKLAEGAAMQTQQAEAQPVYQQAVQAQQQAYQQPVSQSAIPQNITESGEGKILVKKMASCQGDIGMIDGKIILTENMLIFRPNFYQVAADDVIMPLIEITGIEKEKYLFVFNNQMKIILNTGIEYTFMLYGRDVFINLLEQQIKLKGRN
ncbi:MAG: zinc-ribbon domain-containing protein [Spirochaetaceae bacterium]|jgi:hypothetical protein|nr:zinc-ribbon domain-containing protein [Spirochaetaceae bacterium]